MTTLSRGHFDALASLWGWLYPDTQEADASASEPTIDSLDLDELYSVVPDSPRFHELMQSDDGELIPALFLRGRLNIIDWSTQVSDQTAIALFRRAFQDADPFTSLSYLLCGTREDHNMVLFENGGNLLHETAGKSDEIFRGVLDLFKPSRC